MNANELNDDMCLVVTSLENKVEITSHFAVTYKFYRHHKCSQFETIRRNQAFSINGESEIIAVCTLFQ